MVDTAVGPHFHPEVTAHASSRMADLSPRSPRASHRGRRGRACLRSRGAGHRQRRPRAPKVGQVYFWAMTVVALTALVLSLVLPIAFLAMVSVFSFYAAFSAYRVLFLKQLYGEGKATPLDWAAATITFVSSLALAISGILLPRLMGVGLIEVYGHTVSIVAIVFGFLGMSLGARAARTFVFRPKEKMFWWFEHLQGMIASYIAAMTAFSAVNLGRWFGAAWWVWLWPTLVGAPAIAIWKAYYQRKFAKKRVKAAV